MEVSDYVLKGETGSVGDVFHYAYREIKRSACASVVRLEYYGVFSWVALVYRPEFAPPQDVLGPNGLEWEVPPGLASDTYVLGFFCANIGVEINSARQQVAR